MQSIQSIRGLLGIGVLGALAAVLAFVAPARAGNQLYSGSWMVKAFGNERAGGTGESEFYSAVGIPLGVQCNPNMPICPFESTPTDGKGNFSPMGGSFRACAPWYNFGGMGTTIRPAKGETRTTGGKNKRPIPPLYRNPIFFSPQGAPNRTSCTATSTGATPGGKGVVQAGHPVRGTLLVSNTAGTAMGGLAVEAATLGAGYGIRTTGIAGSLPTFFDTYGYTYNYATLRNDAGFFAAGGGPGSFDIQYRQGQNTVASIRVKQGAAKFGGTMRMLGAVTTKVCYPRNGGCSLGTANWLYDAIGAAAPTGSGVVTQGFQALGSAIYFNSGLGQFSTVMIEGSRFPWTTGSVTVTAVGRGPHKTVHYGMGYDNRKTIETSLGGARVSGTLQLVTPVMTRWLLPGASWETGGVGILRLEFVPEPHGWMMLVAGSSLIGVGYRLRGPRSAAHAGP